MTVNHDGVSSSRSRTAIATLVVAASVAALTGCGSQKSDATTVTGSCAMDAKSYATVSPLSTADLEALLGKGSYRVEGNIRPGAGGIADAGQCSYARVDKPDDLLLRVGVNRQTDLFRSYDESRALQKTEKATPIKGADGFTVADPGSGPGSGDQGPLAVVFGADHWTLTLHVVHAKPPVSGDALRGRLASAAKRAAGQLSKPMRRG